MTPDEARKGCWECQNPRPGDEMCQYHKGYADGYEAAQRERGPIEAVGKPLPPGAPLHYSFGARGLRNPGPPHFASEEPQGRPGRS